MEIGIIGLGDMGKLYAREFAKQGYRVNGCDLPERKSQLEQELGETVRVLNDGIAVSRKSDLIFYLVETEKIDSVVSKCGPSTKEGAIVLSGTSVMTPAVQAFEKYLPSDVSIINWHWMFGPSVNPQGQNTAWVPVRGKKEDYFRAREICEKIGTRFVEIPNYQEHDRITADTQVVTHLGFESMGTAWKNAGVFPWENAAYIGGIDNVKILMALRIYGGKSHVYSGLATLNPFAKKQAIQYASSERELFSLMIQEKEKEFRERLRVSGDFAFKENPSHIFLDDRVMGEFNLGHSNQRKPNSHLSLLSMVDAWYQLDTNPYKNLICQTPLFRLRLGIAEYLFKNSELLEESIQTALFDKSIRKDDLEFHTAVNQWASLIVNGDLQGYKQQFDSTKEFFKDRIPEGMKKSNELIKKLQT